MKTFNFIFAIFSLFILSCTSIRSAAVNSGLAKTSYNVDLKKEIGNGNVIAVSNLKILIDGENKTDRCGLVFGDLLNGVAINLLNDGNAYFPMNPGRIKLKFILCKTSSFNGVKVYLKDFQLLIPENTKAFYLGDLTISIDTEKIIPTKLSEELGWPYNNYYVHIDIINNKKTAENFTSYSGVNLITKLVRLPEYLVSKE